MRYANIKSSYSYFKIVLNLFWKLYCWSKDESQSCFWVDVGKKWYIRTMWGYLSFQITRSLKKNGERENWACQNKIILLLMLWARLKFCLYISLHRHAWNCTVCSLDVLIWKWWGELLTFLDFIFRKNRMSLKCRQCLVKYSSCSGKCLLQKSCIYFKMYSVILFANSQ